MQRFAARAMIGLGIAGLLATGSLADEQPRSCTVSSFRGAARPGGSEAAMTVVNDGTPCRIILYVSPERRVPTGSIEVTEPPRTGTVTVAQPNVAAYLPQQGFTGMDHFALRGIGVGSGSAIVTLKVRVSVTVTGKAEEPKRP